MMGIKGKRRLIDDDDLLVEFEEERGGDDAPELRPVKIESAIHRAGAIYALKMIQGAKLYGKMLKHGRVRDPDLLTVVGLELQEDRRTALTPGQLQQAMAKQVARLAQRGMPSLGRLDRNIAQVANLLRLSRAETKVLRLAVVISRVEAFQELIKLRSGLLQSFFGMVQHAVGVRSMELQNALASGCALRRVGILNPGLSYSYGNHPLEMDEEIATLLLAPRFDEKMLLRHVLSAAPAPSLTLQDYPDRLDISMLRRYIQVAIRERRKGINILIHGPTGTGKTEFVRALAHELGVELSEVPSQDASGDPIAGRRRFQSYSLAQSLLALKRRQLLLFDEVEDVFGTGDQSSLETFFRGGGESLYKGWVNQALETNPVPTIWVCNSIGAFDAAYLRRFDLALEFRGPTGGYRQRMVDKHLDQGLVSQSARARLASMEHLPPASIQRISRVVRALRSPGQADRDREAEEVAKLALQAMGRSAQGTSVTLPSHYDPAFLNTSLDLVALSSGLKGQPSARACLYGPPGTGKTAFAHHLSKVLDRPLHLKRASELQSMWAGQTEKNIARAFAAARDEGALLLIDEADSFLQDRGNAQRSWEVRQVNELLTQMEAFDGIFIASTNLMGSLDAASLRRFDFKVNFDYLTLQQRRSLFERVIIREVEDSAAPPWIARLDRMDRLVPGDFANVLRQLKVLGHAATPARLLDMLDAELRLKPGATQRRIGF